MSGPIEDQYFNWLCRKVVDLTSNVYLDLLHMMHKTEFVWIVPGDKNRADEGMELRLAFMTEARSGPDPSWETTGCSVLEMVYAFSQRAEFQTGMPATEWFWKLMENLSLRDYRVISSDDEQVVEEILYALVWRTYERDGRGGLFPLTDPELDQTDVEIWFQFCEYVEEERLA